MSAQQCTYTTQGEYVCPKKPTKTTATATATKVEAFDQAPAKRATALKAKTQYLDNKDLNMF